MGATWLALAVSTSPHNKTRLDLAGGRREHLDQNQVTSLGAF